MKISGKNINFRLVEVEDAEFILNLRNNTRKTKYLSKVEGGLDEQKAWIETYKERERNNREYYFVIESKTHEPLGLVRMYDFQNNSFCWGSWLIKDDAPKTTAIESALQIYEFAFYQLAFTQSHFDVRKGNNKVIAFHKRFGAQITHEDDLDYFFILTKETYENTRKKYKRFL